MVGQGVQEGVGGGVIGLAGVAQGACGRREQHESGQVAVGGQLVQVPGGVGFSGQHGVQLRIGEFGDDGIGKDSGGVDDRGQPVLVGNGVQHSGQLNAVAGVAGGDGDLSTQLG
ncbi:hypothetical protein MSIMFI_05579 [Mycobacterium simulans]|nr:hypothetical protein MSIMFI_05579 [Mycobacterium simulans]